MSLENIYYIGQSVAVVAILGSLLFVGFQVRQNTKAQHLAVQQNYYAAKNAFVSLIAENPLFADIYRKGLSDILSLSETERWQFGAMMQMTFDTALMAYQNPDAFADDIVEASLVTIRPGSVEWWNKGRNLYPPEFQKWIDSAIEKRKHRAVAETDLVENRE